MDTKTLFDFIVANGGVIEIGKLELRISGNDLDIRIGGDIFQWVLDIAEKLDTKVSELYVVTMDDFVKQFCKEHIDETTKNVIAENETLTTKVTNLETENETLSVRLEKAKDNWKKSETERTQFAFLKDFLKDRDIIVHD